MIKEALSPSLFPENETAKELGAFYTDTRVADFLVWWGIRSKSDRVIDPSFGGGVFLHAACNRLKQLAGLPCGQVMGVEIDADVHARIAEALAREFMIAERDLICADFFNLDPAKLPPVDVVVGNPPFIRYQRFSGIARKRALSRCAKEGVRIPELCSSWAPFVVHSTALLKPGGRLAMVVPMEIAHAAYARPVLSFLKRSFAKTTFLTFRRKLFPKLSEDTLLLLAEEKGGKAACFLRRDLADVHDLSALQDRNRPALSGTQRLNEESIANGSERLVESFIPKKAQGLYRELKNSQRIRRLGELADVGIGYVTGSNSFFHLSPEKVRRLRIPKHLLKPAVCRGRALSGLQFTHDDWQKTAAQGHSGYLLHIEQGEELPDNVREYLSLGEREGVAKTYKCSNRSPWFRVPHVYKPDAFLSYMSGATPHLAANDADAVAPNSLHIVRLHKQTTISSKSLAVLWQTSLSRLSVEIEGHALGGGMLKMEPREAENVVIAFPTKTQDSWLEGMAEELNSLIRNEDRRARDVADTAILKKGLDLTQSDCNLLRSAADGLRERRYSRGG